MIGTLKKYLFSFFALFLVTLPCLVFAQTTFRAFVYDKVNPLVTRAMYIVLAMSLLMFLWGLARFILNAGNEVERAKGKQVMIWGIIALFVMMSMMGIVYIIRVALFGTGTGFLPIS